MESRAARAFIAIGVGFLSFFLGALIVPEVPLPAFVAKGGAGGIIFDTVVRQLWVWAVMPALVWGVARLLELRPWGIPVGAAAAGTFFHLSLELLAVGTELLVSYPFRTATLGITTAGGVLLARQAVLSARRAADRRQQAADAFAEARRSEYDAFAAEAARLASLQAQREQVAEVESPAQKYPGENVG